MDVTSPPKKNFPIFFAPVVEGGSLAVTISHRETRKSMDICFKTVRFSHGFPWFSHGFPMVSPRSMCFRRPWPSATFTGRSPREAAKSISRPEANGHLLFDFQGMCQVTYEFAIEHDPFLVDLPMKNGDFPYSYVCLPEGTYEFTWGNFDIQRSQL